MAILAIALWFGLSTQHRDGASPLAIAAPPIPAQAAVVPAVPQPVISTPAASLPPPSFDIVRVSPSGDAVIAGRAAPGATVTITDNGREVGRADANPEGSFVIIPDHPLAVGGRELALAARGADGKTAIAEAPVLVVVPERPGANARVANAANAAPAAAASALALLTSPTGAPRLLQAPPAAPDEASRAVKFGLDIIDYGEHGTIRFAGNAPPGATVRLYVDNKPLGDAVADATHRWMLVPPTDVPPGNHRVRVDLLGAGNQVASRIELPFERAVLALAELAGSRIVVQPKANLWRIARQTYGLGTRYTIIYEANRDQIRNPALIYPGQVFNVPKDTAHAAR